MVKKYTVIDLFCGCGGLSFGFEQAGFQIALGVDNDLVALTTFEKNHRNSKAFLTDITKITGKDITSHIDNRTIDVIVGGPPCQGMSLSGPRKFDDPRNRLYLSFIRLVSELNPRAIVIENVPGLVSLFKGLIKDNIIQRLTNLGYNVSYQVLLASEFGVPQHRRRVVFVGLKTGIFDFDKDIQRSSETITTKMAIDDLPSLTNQLGEEVMFYETEPSNEYQTLLRKDSRYIYNHIAAAHSERVKTIISLVPDGGNYKDLPDEFKNTRNFHVAWTRFPSNQPAPTIDTGHRHHFHYKYNRVPTVRESARIQSFPDRFRFYGNKTEQFRQVGNAVPPLLAEAIAKAIVQKFNEEKDV